MRRLHLAAEGWTAQDQLSIAQVHGISEIGVASRELPDHQRTISFRKTASQICFELSEIEFFAFANVSRVVPEIGRHYVDTCTPYFLSRCRATTILCTSSGPS